MKNTCKEAVKVVNLSTNRNIPMINVVSCYKTEQIVCDGLQIAGENRRAN